MTILDPVLLNALGLFNQSAADPVIIAPNHLTIMSRRNHHYPEDFEMVVEMLKKKVGSGKPMFINVSHPLYYIKDAIVYVTDKARIVYVPAMSYALMFINDGSDDFSYNEVNKVLSTVLAMLVYNGYKIDDLIKEKALTQYFRGKLVTFPELKETNMVVSGGTNKKALELINRYIGRVMKYVASGVKFDMVKHVGKVGNIVLDVTIPIRKVIIATNGEVTYDLQSPIIMSGSISIKGRSVTADGDLLNHPNVNKSSGSICLGTMPPFDGTLAWVGRLLNMLSIPRVDTCDDDYGKSFIDEYGDVLPREAINMWEDGCYDDWEDDEYYDEEDEDYYDET